MASSSKIRVNYFVSGLLAQGGDVILDQSKIVFSPTSSLDRAMGAKEIEISMDEIRRVEQAGKLLRTFTIQTDKRTHKFEGSQANEMFQLIQSALKEKGLDVAVDRKKEANLEPLKPSILGSECPSCKQALKSDYAFCPKCGTSVKVLCQSCQRATEKDWKVCAYCGQAVAQAKKIQELK